jgi:hypothetical protein
MTRILPSCVAAILLLATLSEATPAPANAACTCMSPKRPACEMWWQTSAVFVGRAIRIRTVNEETADGLRVSKIVTLRVAERFQGASGEREIEVRTGAGGGDCGFDFRQNQNYLVYAARSALTGRLETGICTRTARVEDAAPDLEYLRGLADAEPVVSLYGMVYRDREAIPFGAELDRALDPGGPLPGVSIFIEGRRDSYQATADEFGWYEIEGLSTGRYEIRMEGPDADPDERWIFRIPLAPACIWHDVIAVPRKSEGPGQSRQPPGH